MQKRFLIFLILGLFVFVPAVQAQGITNLAELEVDLWPEYDQPEGIPSPYNVLVIYKAKLPANVSLPVDVTFKIPAIAGDPFAVAVRQMNGDLLNAAHTRQVDGDWALITITATMPEIQMEYYDLQIEKDGDERNYSYVWPGDYNVDLMRMVIQQPIGASQMSVEPNLGSFTQISGDPMQYYVMEVGSPKAGEKFSVEVHYSKDTDSLSVENLQVQPTGPINGNDGGGQSNLLTYLPWLIAGLGLLLLAGGLLWYWRMRRLEKQSTTKKRSRRSKSAIKSPEQISAENGNQGVFCHQCGKRAVSGDRFCRSCGSKLRQ